MAFALLHIFHRWIETLQQSFYIAKTKQMTQFHCVGCLCSCLATVLNMLFLFTFNVLDLSIDHNVLIYHHSCRRHCGGSLYRLYLFMVIYSLKVSSGFSIDSCEFLNYNKNECKKVC